MELNQEQQKEAVARAFNRYGGVLPDAPSGAVIPRFNALELAVAIEKEINRSAIMGWTKMSIHVDIVDAVQLAKFLKGEK